MMNLKSNRGFSLTEVLVTIVMMTVALFLALNYSSFADKNRNVNRNLSTKNRVLSGIRDFAGMPATLRASMRAANAGTVVNPELLACAGGNPTNKCENGAVSGFTMFAPIIARDASGNILGVQAISSPPGSTDPLRIDSFGSPCKVASSQCPFLVFTTMKAQCGPPPRPVGAPSPTSADLVPMSTCTVAEAIEVTYSVQLDPNVSASDPLLRSFITPSTGSVTLPVVQISGNVPQ